ncbi:MAG: transglutaminase domain-containing protein, partial [Desulfovibrionaceae bacterium]|nr:transglutaminase domain-containing protein [Desulfovibrionaceae bacterium]
MSQLFDYLFDIEAAPDDDRSADGLCAMFLNVRATGTCGVTTPGEIPCDGPVPGEEDEDGYVPGDGGCSGIVFPSLEAAGQATVGTAADMALPVIRCQALGPWWFPGAGDLLLPTPGLAGTARILVLSASALPPLFALARAAALVGAILPGPQGAALAGALADAALPPGWTLLAASGLDRRGDVLVRLPVPIPEGHSCGLVNPVVRRTPQAAVVGLLNRDSAMLAALAAALTPGLDDPDDMAAALLYAVSNLLDYVSDPESLDFGDRWTCSLGTWFRGQGDCEDGAILLHGLLLARGVASFRLVTIFGRMAPDGMGHAWTCYKRACDARWTVLDWTAGPRSPLAGPDDLTRLDQSPGYHLVEYVLTGEGFHPARMPVADFFAAVRADGLTLPLPECAAAANRAAKGSLRLGSATLFGGPLVCGALAGNDGTMILPALAAAVAAGWRSGRA